MQIVSLVWGVLALLGMVIAFLPCLGALNWFNIPFAGVGLILSIIALATSKFKGKVVVDDRPFKVRIETEKAVAIAAVVANSVAVAIGVIRLVLGGGIL